MYQDCLKILPPYPARDISNQRASWSGQVNFRNGFRTKNCMYPKSLPPFLRILCDVDNSHIYMQKELISCAPRRRFMCPRFISLAIIIFRWYKRRLKTEKKSKQCNYCIPRESNHIYVTIQNMNIYNLALRVNKLYAIILL